MPVYASAHAFADRRAHPRALLLVVGAHAALLAAVMSAKMDLPAPLIPTITQIDLIETPKPPPPEPQPQVEPRPSNSIIDEPVTIIPIPQPSRDPIQVTPIPLPPNPGDIIGPSVDPQPQPAPRIEPVRVGPRFATPDWALRPPYPEDKRRLEEEAVLRLRLSIDERGRVVSVEPVGSADRSFLEAARRHLVRHWRYKPATEGARPVPSSTVITLTFRLED